MYRAICNSVAESATYTVAGDTRIGFDTTVLSALNEVLTVTVMFDFDGRLGSTANRPAGRTTSTTPPPASAYVTAATANTDDVNHAIVAPGACIRSTWKGDQQAQERHLQDDSGTSMAPLHLAGTTSFVRLPQLHQHPAGRHEQPAERRREQEQSHGGDYLLRLHGASNSVATGVYYVYPE